MYNTFIYIIYYIWNIIILSENPKTTYHNNDIFPFCVSHKRTPNNSHVGPMSLVSYFNIIFPFYLTYFYVLNHMLLIDIFDYTFFFCVWKYEIRQIVSKIKVVFFFFNYDNNVCIAYTYSL